MFCSLCLANARFSCQVEEEKKGSVSLCGVKVEHSAHSSSHLTTSFETLVLMRSRTSLYFLSSLSRSL